MPPFDADRLVSNPCHGSFGQAVYRKAGESNNVATKCRPDFQPRA